MKKFLMIAAIIATAAGLTSCKSDAEKAAQLKVDAREAKANGDIKKMKECQVQYEELEKKNADNPNWDQEVDAAYEKLKNK